MRRLSRHSGADSPAQHQHRAPRLRASSPLRLRVVRHTDVPLAVSCGVPYVRTANLRPHAALVERSLSNTHSARSLDRTAIDRRFAEISTQLSHPEHKSAPRRPRIRVHSNCATIAQLYGYITSTALPSTLRAASSRNPLGASSKLHCAPIDGRILR